MTTGFRGIIPRKDYLKGEIFMIHNQIVICKDKEAVGKAAAEHYIALMNTKPGCVLGLATGSTPIPLYKKPLLPVKANSLWVIERTQKES